MSKRFLAFNDFDELVEMPPGGTNEMLKTDLRRCLKESTLLSTMTVSTAIELLHAFLESGHSITLDPTFPKKPPNAFSIFIKKLGQNRFSSDASNMWKSESNAAEKAEAEREALHLMEKYITDLQAFKEKYPNLTESHSSYVDNLMANAQKTINKSKAGKCLNNKKKLSKKKEQKTAFDLFALTLTSKYADMEPEKREKKLRKKFDRLNCGEREIYEKLAAAL
ncbi:unnamed protein product [Thelazia callipaeda]|uniref:HMG box domain-containing protein n=1 Tax=Thelazia callipaeda TaxID=103827 RepID=A0A0N5CSF4_THECL|nr:unnamed protein product [Thelazia callipaeda]